MPYVQRTDGKVTGIFANSQSGYAEEWLEDYAQDIVDYRNYVIATVAVSRRQFMYGLYVYQLREQAEASVAAAPELVQINWANASEFRIDDPMLVELVTQLGKIDVLQEFFNFCSTL